METRGLRWVETGKLLGRAPDDPRACVEKSEFGDLPLIAHDSIRPIYPV